MKVFALIGLVILSMLFIFTALLGSVIWSVNATLLKPYESIRYLEQSGIYDRFGGIVADMFATTTADNNQSNEQAPSPEEKQLRDTVAASLNKILTREYVASKFTPLQTQFWDYMTDKSELSPGVEIPEVREQVLQAIMANSSLSEQLKAEAPENVNGTFPASIDIAQLANQSQSENQGSENSNSIDFVQIKETYHSISLATVGLYAAFAVLLIFCVLITLYLKNTTGWIGTILLIPGIFILVESFGLKSVSAFVPISDLPEAFQVSVTQIISDVTSDMSSQLLLIAVIFLVASILTYMSKRIIALFRGNKGSVNAAS